MLTVTENESGIHIRQDRFLETGPAEAKENETIWYISYVSSACHLQFILTLEIYRTIPLSLLSVDGSGKASVDKSAVLDSREKTIKIDTSKPFKLNAGTSGVC